MCFCDSIAASMSEIDLYDSIPAGLRRIRCEVVGIGEVLASDCADRKVMAVSRFYHDESRLDNTESISLTNTHNLFLFSF